MLCHLDISRSRAFSVVMVPFTESMLNSLSRSVCRSMEYLEEKTRGLNTKYIIPLHVAPPSVIFAFVYSRSYDVKIRSAPADPSPSSRSNISPLSFLTVNLTRSASKSEFSDAMRYADAAPLVSEARGRRFFACRESMQRIRLLRFDFRATEGLR